MKVLDETISECSVCNKPVSANIIEKGGRVYIEKDECCQKELVYLDENAEIYDKVFISSQREIPLIGTVEDRIDDIVTSANIFQLYATLDCNIQCPICYNKNENRIVNHLPFSEIARDFDKYKSRYMLVLSGGEPTILPNLPEIIRIVTKKFKVVCLTTNGIKLADIDYCKELKEAGLQEVDLSFDGFNDEIYKKYRGQPLLDIKLKAFNNLKELKITTYLMAVISKESLEEIPKIIKFAGLNKDIVETIWFGSLFNPDLKKPEITRSEIIMELCRLYNLDVEYFAEWKKLKQNVYLFYKSIGQHKAHDDLIYNTFPFKVDDSGQLIPIYTPEQLNELSDIITDLTERRLPILKTIKNLPVLINLSAMYLTHRFMPDTAHYLLRRNGIIKIWLGWVSTPQNRDYKRDITEGVYLIEEGDTHISTKGMTTIL